MININEVDFLPTSPGCYIFKDAKGKVLYVGKAKNLKNRVKSYFVKTKHTLKTNLLVKRINKIDFIITKTESEAFLLENNLIKLHYPKFNIDLKDSRRYAYLMLTKDEYPLLEVARKRNKEGEYFGPFVSGRSRIIVMDTITRNFKILTKHPSKKLKSILIKEDYNKRVKNARRILKGQTKSLIEELTKEMQKNSKINNFEYSITLRNQIEALNTLKEKQVMENAREIDAHIINYQIVANKVYLLVFNVRKGIVEDKQEFVFEEKEDFLEEFLVRLYETISVPSEIILPIKLPSYVGTYLSKQSKVKIIVPSKGEKKELLDFVYQNITPTFFAGKERLEELKKILHLTNLPRLIECFDVSHLSGTNTVAGMVVFQNGVANKSLYRKFKIKSITNSDDYLALEEAVQRRYNGSLIKTMRFPDLIVIDGGKGQLSRTKKVLDDLNLKIPIISLAEQFEEIFIPLTSIPIKLEKSNKGLQLLINIRDEAHRFSNSYRKVLKSKEIK